VQIITRSGATESSTLQLNAAVFFDGRLPEAFAGYARELTEYPVEYPTACSPQAWATGAPLLLLRVLLGLEAEGEHLIVNPALPGDVETLALLDIPGRWGQADAFARGRLPGVQLDLLAQFGVAGLQTEQPSSAAGAPADTFRIIG
jgi:hypothetical protein